MFRDLQQLLARKTAYRGCQKVNITQGDVHQHNHCPHSLLFSSPQRVKEAHFCEEERVEQVARHTCSGHILVVHWWFYRLAGPLDAFNFGICGEYKNLERYVYVDKIYQIYLVSFRDCKWFQSTCHTTLEKQRL